jgi:hypothetical protein
MAYLCYSYILQEFLIGFLSSMEKIKKSKGIYFYIKINYLNNRKKFYNLVIIINFFIR